jgi:hypothetical protein
LIAAISLVIILTLFAVETRVNLSPYTNSRPLFNERYFGADPDSSPDNFVAATQWPVLRSPSASEGVDIRATNTACLDLDIYIKLFKRLGFELQYKSVLVLVIE